MNAVTRRQAMKLAATGAREPSVAGGCRGKWGKFMFIGCKPHRAATETKLKGLQPGSSQSGDPVAQTD